MDVSHDEQNLDASTDRFPLLVESRVNHENQHVIDLESGSDDETSSSNASTSSRQMDRSPREPTSQLVRASSNGSSSLGRRRWSPFDTLLWISAELVFTLGQVIASVVVLYISRNENPQTPLFAWIVGYAGGCVASLPFLYWRYVHRNQATSPGSNQARQPPSEGSQEQNSYITISFARPAEEETRSATSRPATSRPATSPDTWNGLNVASDARLTMLVDHFKMALDCFFAVWFVVGNVWIFGGHSSSAEAPNLYRLCIVFLTFSCIGYAMPFILCGMICCCLPCIISILGVHEDMNQVRGASDDSINALPTHKFKLKKNGNNDAKDNEIGVDEGGILAPGTEKERAISGEDAVCCICLAKYADNDLLRELPCTHFFHIECVDKWLKINASCPLCKFEIGASNEAATSTEDTNQQQS